MRTAIITRNDPHAGGNSGIGLAAAKQFVNEGAYVSSPRTPRSLMGNFMNSVRTLKTNQNDFERSAEPAADFIERVRVNRNLLLN